MPHTSGCRDEERWVEQEPQTVRERAVLLLRALIPGRLPIPTSGFQRLVWTIWIAIVLVIARFIVLAVDKGLWDWLQLLIVPAALALGVAWLNWTQSQRAREAQEAQQERERAAEETRRARELEVENQRAQDAALQAYLDQMSQLLTDKERPLRRAQPGDNLSVVARARTLTVLTRLDGERKQSVLQFLYESGLISRDRPILHLSGANLSGADLSGVLLRGANLSGAYLSGAALLIRANLSGANLVGSDLIEAPLSGANLVGSDLNWADLSKAYLSDVRGVTPEELE
jgi:uncharacterized protein YjbI with pentapeptide repeats